MIKFGGLILPTSSKEGIKSYNNSLQMSKHLSESIQQLSTFNFVNHLQTINEERKRIKLDNIISYTNDLSRRLENEENDHVKRQITISRETGSWLSTIPSIINGTELSMIEFRDRLHQRYNHNPLNMCKKCDGCGKTFTLSHALSCKNED